MPHATNETLRKSLHIAFGFAAFTLKWLPWTVAAAVCVVAVASNWLLLHRLVGRRVARHERGFDAGIVLYPVMVLLLVLTFRHHLHYAAIAWVMLAFGDGIATLAGKSMRIAPLPWNRDKSVGGLLAFILAATAGGIAVAYWMDYRAPVVVLLTAIVAAVVESLPLGVDDNVTVPFASAVTLIVAGIQTASPYSVWPATIPWLIANAVLALLGYFARSVNFSGALGGFVLGAILILGGGWPLYVALLAFFIIGSATTKLGYARKARAGLAQEGGGRRGFSHAFSNVGVAAICAITVSRLARSVYGANELELLPLFMGIAALARFSPAHAAARAGRHRGGDLGGRNARRGDGRFRGGGGGDAGHRCDVRGAGRLRLAHRRRAHALRIRRLLPREHRRQLEPEAGAPDPQRRAELLQHRGRSDPVLRPLPLKTRTPPLRAAFGRFDEGMITAGPERWPSCPRRCFRCCRRCCCSRTWRWCRRRCRDH
jgi:dolichol kinase